jgi:hypothetical protein
MRARNVVTYTGQVKGVLGATGQPQNGAGSYQSWPTSAEVAALRARGGALARVMDFVRLMGGRLCRGRERPI